MSQFYARYVPPVTNKTNTTLVSSAPSLKRPNPTKATPQNKKRKVEDSKNGAEIISKYSLSEAAKKTKTEVKIRKQPQQTVQENEPDPAAKITKRKEKKQNRAQEAAEEEKSAPEPHEQDKATSKHSKVLSRYIQSKEDFSRRKEYDPGITKQPRTNDIHPDRVKLHDLAPIPQPKVSTAAPLPPTFLTAPEWLLIPVRASNAEKKTFDELGLHERLVQTLRIQGKDAALPIQSAVLPLLLDKEVESRPDLCVAAATGSGKTFAYVLPIVSSLRKKRNTRLRAVIVVPTRALVKQAAQALDSCSAGLGVRTGTAEGSKTLCEEQRQLIEEKWIYDPDEYRRQREAPIDWSTFSLEDVMDETNDDDPIEKLGRVQRFDSKVDVLVSTPGRLIEHLQFTKGFNLDDVQWFVADEADRLLNESYHEWLETVLPALKSQKATEKRDKMLEYMHLDVPKRRVTKILLSATMTNDISKLLGLELTNPKLVVIDDVHTDKGVADEEIEMADADSEYQLPSKLQEYAVAFKDSENKPLYLLELLNKHIFASHSTVDQEQKPLANGSEKRVTAKNDTSSSASSSESVSDSDSSIQSSSAAFSLEKDSDTSSDPDSDTSSSPSLSASSITASASKSHHQLSKSTITTKQSSNTVPRILIFTKSTQSAHRLSRLLSLLSPTLTPLLATFTRSSNRSSSHSASTTSSYKAPKNALQSFISGPKRILISTDLSARGLDIPSLAHVINYDVPSSALSYIHRVGRTARVGKEGKAWTLVEWRQGRWFWEIIGGKKSENDEQEQEHSKATVGRGKDKIVKKVNVHVNMKEWKEKYEEALKQLGEDVRTA